ncbi:MAG: cupin protein [Bacteroidota bacterium]|nr:cupin protein [Bacteroidota bacterium]
MKRLTLEATGETTTFLKTTKETDGKYLEVVIDQLPGQKGPSSHKHTQQTEYFEVIEGLAEVISGNKKVILQPGESFTIPENTYHTYSSVDQKRLKLKVKLKPAFDMEYFLEQTYVSANAHHSENASFLDNCYMITEMKGQYFQESIPIFIQKKVYPLIAKIAKRLALITVKGIKDYEL